MWCYQFYENYNLSNDTQYLMGFSLYYRFVLRSEIIGSCLEVFESWLYIYIDIKWLKMKCKFTFNCSVDTSNDIY